MPNDRSRQGSPAEGGAQGWSGEELFFAALAASHLPMVVTDPGRRDNPILRVNAAFETLTGYHGSECTGRNCRFLQGRDTDPATARRLGEAVGSGEAVSLEILNYRKDGASFWNELHIAPVGDAGSAPRYFLGILSDVTRRRGAEQDLRQARKMEAVGQLAVTLAHDLNNMLTVITGNLEMAAAQAGENERLRRHLSLALEAASRSEGMTRQLLTFAKQQKQEPDPAPRAMPAREGEGRLDLPGGTETILVVEDNAGVRRFADEVLTDLGYTVLTAAGGGDAARLMQANGRAIDLLFADLVLPGGVTGPNLARDAREHHPGVKVLLTSGYVDPMVADQSRGLDFALLSKPYRSADLARRVREVLDE